MKVMLLFFALLVCVPPARAEVACTQSGKTCDQKERCMYERQIAMKQQLAALHADPGLRKKALDKARLKHPGNDEVSLMLRSHLARDIFQELLEKMAMDGKTIKLAKCGAEPSSNPEIRNPYSMFTDQNCDMHYVNDKDQEVSKEEALELNTCEEFNSAARIHELWHVNRCQWAKANPSSQNADRKDLDTYINEERESYQHEINYLKEEKSWRKMRCSPKTQKAKDAGNNARRLIKKVGPKIAGRTS
jgi:hypothetical protein